MTNRTFSFRILTLGGEVLRGEVTQIEVKSFDGWLGVMARHEPMIAACPAGIIRIQQDGGWVHFKADEFLLVVERHLTTILTPAAKYAGPV
jgi:F0F1-type ATP synthase epsilon subunit